MKKIALMAACVLLTGAAALAQPGGFGGPGGGMPPMGGGMPPMGGFMRMGQQAEMNADLVAEYSDFMVQKYKLNEDQAAKVRDLNASYVGKMVFQIPFDLRQKFMKEHQPAEGEQGRGRGRRGGMDTQEGRDAQADSIANSMRNQFRNMQEMTDEQRQEMMNQMQQRMQEAQEAADRLEENKEAYEEALEQILDKNQFKAYKKEIKREEEREQRRQEGEMRRQFQRQAGRMGGGLGVPVVDSAVAASAARADSSLPIDTYKPFC